MPKKRGGRRDRADLMDESVLAQGFPGEGWTDAELADAVRLSGGEHLDWWIVHLRQAETSVRRLRKRMEALRDGRPSRVCPGCGGPVTGRADAVYCGSGCRLRAYRARLSRS